MNTTQKNILLCGIFIFIMLGIVPPWTQTFKAQGIYSEEPLGYHPIIIPPETNRSGHRFGVKIDTSRLFIQWLIVFVSTGAFIVVSGNSVKDGQKKQQTKRGLTWPK